MNAPAPIIAASPHPGMRFAEFVAMMASLMAVNALGIDMMLPALPTIGADLGVAIENHRQWIIAAYVGGFGVAQLFFGPLADHFGRRPVLIGAMIVYAIMSFGAAHADSFAMLLAARVLQGMASASTRVLTISIIRDCYDGRRMARVMSLSFMAFLLVPVLAPTIGQAVLLVAPWHGIFYALGGFSLFVCIWAGFRLPETLHPELRRPIRIASLVQGVSITLRNRYSLGYTIAMACVFAGLMGFINSSQQIFTEIFDAPRMFPLIFAAIASAMAAAALLNSRIVERYGTRRVSHSALLGMIATSIVHVAVALAGLETIVTFGVLQAITMFFFGLTGSNFGSMAMDDMSEIAGTASSVQGFLSTIVGAVIGLMIGQSFDHSTLPLALGFAVGGLAALIIVLIVERGRLFQPQHERPID